MADKPILFSAPMVRALLDGRKSQTRRVIKSRGELPDFCGGRGDAHNDPESYGWEDYERGGWITLDQFRHWNFVPFAIGDRLWVREGLHVEPANDPANVYIADGERVIWRNRDQAVWLNEYANARVPSIHMPRWASRLTLTVTDVRVQRLQDISALDVSAEGVRADCPFHTRYPNGHPNMTPITWSDGQDYTATAAFKRVWNSINGPDAWAANPWIVALTFDVHRCNIDAMP